MKKHEGHEEKSHLFMTFMFFTIFMSFLKSDKR